MYAISGKTADCIVYAKKPKPSDVIFDDTFDDTFSVSSNGFIDGSNSTETEWTMGSGLLINKSIIITSSHIVSNAEQIYCEYQNSLNSFTLGNYVQGYDISVLLSRDDITYSDVCDILSPIEFVHFTDASDGDEFDTHSDPSSEPLKLKLIGKTYTQLTSAMYPRIPMYKCRINNKTDKHNITPYGLSGTFVYKKDIIVGMIVSSVRDEIEILPMDVIKTLIINYCNLPIKGIPINVSLCEIEESSGDITCLHVDETSLPFATDKKKNIMFKHGDLIVEIDGLRFDKNGHVFCSEIDSNVPYDTYVLLHNVSTVNISYHKHNDDKKKNITIQKKILDDSIFRIRISDYKNYYARNGLIFTELSEKLIIYCNEHNISLPPDIIKSYNKMISTTDKVIILINVGGSANNIKSQFKKYNVYDKRIIKFPILIKVGNKRIKYLSDISEAQSTVYSFLNDDYTEFKVVLD